MVYLLSEIINILRKITHFVPEQALLLLGLWSHGTHETSWETRVSH